MMYLLGPISVLVTLYLPAAVQWYFFMSGVIGVVQNWAFTNPSFRREMNLPVVTPPRPNFSNTIPTTFSYEAPRSGSAQDGTIKGVLSSAQNALKQTIHDAKGGAGSFMEAAQKKQEAQDAKRYEKRRAEMERQRRYGNRK